MKNTLLLSSYLKSILSEAHSLSSTIKDRALTYKERQANIDPHDYPLTQAQLNSVLAGPFHPLVQQTIRALSTLFHWRQQHAIQHETIFKPFREIKDAQTLSPNQVKSVNPGESEAILKKINQIALDTNERYNKKLAQWFEAIQKQLDNIGVPLSTHEKEELNKLHPIPELLSILSDFSITHSAPKKAKFYDFKHYTTLKCRIAIQGSLGRNQLPSDDNIIKSHIKNIKSVLDKIHDEEKELIQEIESEMRTALKPLAFASLNV